MHTEVTDRFAVTAPVHVVQKGLTAGTNIMTMEGILPVEHLQPGDRIITRGSGRATLRAIRVREVAMHPVKISAGALGYDRPDETLTLGPDTFIHIRDWRARALYDKPSAMVPASRLCDGEFITRAEEEVTMRLYDLVFEKPEIIYADGLEIGASVG